MQLKSNSKMKSILSDDGLYFECFTKKGEAFFIDASDYEVIKKHSWYISKRGYVTTNIKRKATPMHKILLGENKGFDVDHISGNKLDNRRSNLRICTHQQNMFNQKIRSTNKTGFIGVSLIKKIGKYEAYIHHNGRKKYLGIYKNPIEAAIERDKEAIKIFGKFARLNFGHDIVKWFNEG